MAEQQYDLFFCGDILEGHYLDFVKSDLQRLFKADDSYIDKLFTGSEQAIKLHVDKPTAIKYQKAFKAAGAKLIVRLHSNKTPQVTTKPTRPNNTVPASNPPPISAASSNSALKLTTVDHSIEGENSNNLIERHQPDISAPTTIPDWNIAHPGVRLVEPVEVEMPDIDTSGLSVANVGEDLLTRNAFESPAPIINTETISLAPPGTELDTLDEKPAPVKVDTSHLTIKAM